MLLWGLSDPGSERLRCFSIKLPSIKLLWPSGGKYPRHAQNPLSGEWIKILSITHYALSPHPTLTSTSVYHSSHRWTVMPPKWPLVPKSQVKHYFTISTAWNESKWWACDASKFNRISYYGSQKCIGRQMDIIQTQPNGFKVSDRLSSNIHMEQVLHVWYS